MSGVSAVPVTGPLMLGEGPHWNAQKQVLYFVDLLRGEVHSYYPDSKEHYSAKVGDQAIGMILPVEGQSDKFVIAYGGSLEIITWDGKSDKISNRQKYIELESNKEVRLNDGKASPSGVIFVGSMAEKLADQTVPPGKGNLFLIDRRGSSIKPVKIESNVGISNGLCWNHDETKFIWADTLAKTVYVYDYDAKNLTVSNRKVLLDYNKKKLKGFPDGMTIDTNGMLFIASVDGGGEVIKVDQHSGEVLQHIPIPAVSNVSSVAFGGKNMDELYVTTIKKEGESSSGTLFKITGLKTKGCPGKAAKI